MAPALSTAAPRRLLVRGVNWLGDAVMSAPALRRLRERHPHAAITLLTHERIADLWRGQDCVDEALTFAPGESPWHVGRRLREGNFDIALLFPNSPRSALEAWWAGVPQRLGFGGRWRRWFLTEVVPAWPGFVPMRKRGTREIRRLVSADAAADAPSEATPIRAAPGGGSRHQIHHYLHLAAALGASADPVAPLLEICSAEVDAARARWLAPTDKAATAGTPIILGLNPSAAYGEAKRWPAGNFATVAREVSRKWGSATWIAFGARGDEELCESLGVQAGVPILNLAGKTSLRELMALIKLCGVLLTNDSGPMHLAAALGTPVVVPFGSTSPELTGPALPNDPRHSVLCAGVPCSPCFRRTCPIDFRCMTRIRPDQVVDAVLAAVQARSR